MAPTSVCLPEAKETDGQNCFDGYSASRQGRGQFVPLVIGLVGLPGHGKTVLGHKLQKYLTWTGHRARVFSVSGYRRKHIDYTNHDFFRADNDKAIEVRKQSHLEAMQDAEQWIKDGGEIVILDSTHSTMAMRQTVHNFFMKQLKCKVLFIECLIDDKTILESNVSEIAQMSDDYRHMDPRKAKDDVHQKIKHYLDQYKPICPKSEISYSYIKFHNAGENISVHHLDGPYQTKVLGYLSNFRPLQKTLYFTRHGESEYNLLGRIGGDANLSSRGHKYGTLLADYFNNLQIPNLQVWTSEKVRTKQTAEEIKAPVENLVPLNELDAGICEGLTYEEIQEKFPQEFAWRDQDKLKYRYPWGESYLDIISRLEPVLLELEREDNVLVISHQAVLRCILGYFLNTQPDQVPYLKVPLHTVIKLTTIGYECHLEFIEFKVECVDTYRKRPEVCNNSH